MARFSLNKKELSTEVGESLLDLLMDVTSDGMLTDAEIDQVNAWIEKHGQELPAASYLAQVLETIMRDRQITLAERRDMVLAIEKVLPVEERQLVKMRRRGAPEPATEKQLDFLKALGVKHGDISKWEASDLIDEAKYKRDSDRDEAREEAAHQRSLYRSSSSGGRRKKNDPGCLGYLMLFVVVYALYKYGTKQ